jgi:Cu2+-exporting ATPase
MKTSVIEIRDMLSVLSVFAVEERIGEVPGVESVTVNYAAGNATVRYDETRLELGDIKSAVRQSGYLSEGESLPKHEGAPKQASESPAAHRPQPAPASGPTPEAAAPGPAPAAPTAGDRQDKAAPNAAPSAPPAAEPG